VSPEKVPAARTFTVLFSFCSASKWKLRYVNAKPSAVGLFHSPNAGARLVGSDGDEDAAGGERRHRPEAGRSGGGLRFDDPGSADRGGGRMCRRREAGERRLQSNRGDTGAAGPRERLTPSELPSHDTTS